MGLFDNDQTSVYMDGEQLETLLSKMEDTGKK